MEECTKPAAMLHWTGESEFWHWTPVFQRKTWGYYKFCGKKKDSLCPFSGHYILSLQSRTPHLISKKRFWRRWRPIIVEEEGAKTHLAMKIAVFRRNSRSQVGQVFLTTALPPLVLVSGIESSKDEKYYICTLLIARDVWINASSRMLSTVV